MTENKKYQLMSMGSAILDVISQKDSEFLEKQNLVSGSMALVSYEESEKLYQSLGGSITECSGGSTANTAASFASLGGKASFLGKTRSDYSGNVFIKEMNNIGCDVICEPTTKGNSTSKCIVLVTEEEGFKGRKQIERTMVTYLDGNVIVGAEDITEELISSTEVLFIEGYLFDNENSKAAIKKSIKIAKENNVKVAFSLSDAFCVERHLEDFNELVADDCDLLFCNESEIKSLYKDKPLDEVFQNLLAKKNFTGCITKSAEGSTIISDGKMYEIEATEVGTVYDVTGAGDTYAAGFLYGYVNNQDLTTCGKLGSACAAEVIKFLGARPLTDLKEIRDQIIK